MLKLIPHNSLYSKTQDEWLTTPYPHTTRPWILDVVDSSSREKFSSSLLSNSRSHHLLLEYSSYVYISNSPLYLITGQCADGWESYSTNYCYLVVAASDQQLSWVDASTMCAGYGGSMMKITKSVCLTNIFSQ